MFADLDRIDIVYAREDGRRVAVQTDHRSSAELEADEPRSVVFALARVLGPMSSDAGLDAVEYVFKEMPPARLRRALEAAGCAVRIGDELVEGQTAPDEALVDSLAGEALEAVGLDALTRLGAAPTEEGLRALEQALSASRAGFGDWDAERRHTAVLELGAAAGVVLQGVAGAEWVRDTYFGAPIPFTVDAGGNRCNLFGRAHRFYAESSDDGPSVLLRSLDDGRHQDGLVLPVLRPSGFGGDVAPTSRPLLALDPVPETMPYIFLVQDRPETVAYLHHETVDDFDALLEASLENLARVPVTPSRVDGGDLPFFVLEGSFYAAAKILDRRLIAGLAETLGADALMVAVPARDVALLAPFPVEPAVAASFLDLVQAAYREQTESHRLSDLVFMATAAEGFQGLLQVQEKTSGSSAWWKKILG